MYIVFTIIIVFAYLLGSVPFGLIIAKAHNKDLLNIGSGNIGATNVSRALGKKWGFFCFVLDALKGFVPMAVTAAVIPPSPGTTELFLWLIVGCAAVLGHIFPIYIKFKGGKGVATSFGIALGLWPYYTICALAAIVIWTLVVLVWRYISLGSIIASVVFPVALIFAIILTPEWNFANLWPLLIAAIAIPLMVILRHRDNIRRLIAGTESKILKDRSN